MYPKKIIENESSFSILFSIWKYLSKRRKFQLVLFTNLNILSSFSESLSIALTLPLISVLIDPERIWQIRWLQNIFLNLGIYSSSKIILPITLLFILASIISTFIKLFILRTNNFFAAAIGNDLSCLTYSRTLNQPYEKHIELNSSETISATTTYVDSTREAIYSVLNFLSYFCFVITIEITLFVFNWRIALFSIFIFGISYFFISYKSKLVILKNAKKQKVSSFLTGGGFGTLLAVAVMSGA